MVLVDTVLQIQIEKVRTGVKRVAFKHSNSLYPKPSRDSLRSLQLGGTRSFSGLTTLWSIVGGIPIFWYSKRIFVLHGGWKMIWSAMLIVAIRLPLLAYFVATKDDLNYILPIQFFHGTAFALLWSGGTDYLQQHAPPSIVASTQTILSTTYFTVGQGVGNAFWMSMYESRGPRDMYKMGTALTLAVLGGSFYAVGTLKGNGKQGAEGGEDEGELLPVMVGRNGSRGNGSGGKISPVLSRQNRRSEVHIV